MLDFGSWLVAQARPLSDATFSVVEPPSSTLVSTLVQAMFPAAAYVALAPVLWLFFRRT
jgi:hypothetical protein